MTTHNPGPVARPKEVALRSVEQLTSWALGDSEEGDAYWDDVIAASETAKLAIQRLSGGVTTHNHEAEAREWLDCWNDAEDARVGGVWKPIRARLVAALLGEVVALRAARNEQFSRAEDWKRQAHLAVEDLEAEVGRVRQQTEQLRQAAEPSRETRDYLTRTIATIRNHRDADNCWPQWANLLADEVERVWTALAGADTPPRTDPTECDCRHRKDGLLHEPHCSALNPPSVASGAPDEKQSGAGSGSVL